MCARVRMHRCGDQRYLPQSLFTILFETKVLNEHVGHCLARLTAQQA